MPINPDDIKALAEHALIPRLYERFKRLTDEKVEVLRNSDEATSRMIDIDNELAGLEARLKEGAKGLRVVLNKVDPPGQP